VTFNLESLVLPDSQVHPLYTPSSRPIFGDVRRCSVMFGDVRRCSARFGDVRRCSAMFGDVRRCSAMFGEIRRCSAMFGDIIRCSAMLDDIIRASIHDRDTTSRPTRRSSGRDTSRVWHYVRHSRDGTQQPARPGCDQSEARPTVRYAAQGTDGRRLGARRQVTAFPVHLLRVESSVSLSGKVGGWEPRVVW